VVLGLRERFQAGRITGLADERTISQLAQIRYRPNSRGQIVIESKEELLRRGVKSPDRADSVMLAFAKRHDPGAAFIESAFRYLERRSNPSPETSATAPWRLVRSALRRLLTGSRRNSAQRDGFEPNGDIIRWDCDGTIENLAGDFRHSLAAAEIKRVLILGGEFGGIHAALKLEQLLVRHSDLAGEQLHLSCQRIPLSGRLT
jgi:hypothetical protein